MTNEMLGIQVGLIFFIVGFWNFTPASEAIFTFPQEREMLSKERTSRMYRLSSYFAARLVGDLPMELILPTVFTTITYWMGGLKPTALSYTTFLIITLATVLVSQGLGLAIGAFVMDLRKAVTFSSILMLCFMLVGGFFVQKVPPFVAWIKYLSITFHTFKLLLVTQFTPTDLYECAPGLTCSVTDLPQVKVVGFEHKEYNIIIMLIMLISCRFLAYLGLRKIGVHS